MFRMLIVDDGAIFRQLLREVLSTKFPLAEVHEAVDAEEAFKKIQTLVFDFIFIDIHLRDQNGLELAKRIKSAHPETTVIILTNYDAPEYREVASQFGADHFMPKDSFVEMINTLSKSRRIPI